MNAFRQFAGLAPLLQRSCRSDTLLVHGPESLGGVGTVSGHHGNQH
jgi:hypothetical protein